MVALAIASCIMHSFLTPTYIPSYLPTYLPTYQLTYLITLIYTYLIKNQLYQLLLVFGSTLGCKAIGTVMTGISNSNPRRVRTAELLKRHMTILNCFPNFSHKLYILREIRVRYIFILKRIFRCSSAALVHQPVQ